MGLFPSTGFHYCFWIRISQIWFFHPTFRPPNLIFLEFSSFFKSSVCLMNQLLMHAMTWPLFLSDFGSQRSWMLPLFMNGWSFTLFCMFFLNLRVTIVESPLQDIDIYLLRSESLTLGRYSLLFPSGVSYLNHVVHVKEKGSAVFALLQKSDHFISLLRKYFSRFRAMSNDFKASMARNLKNKIIDRCN